MTHGASGWSVTAKCKICRRSWCSTTNTLKILKGHRRHCEEVRADQGIPMVAEEDQPALELVGRSATPGQISGHRPLIDLEAQLQQFAMNPRCSPTIFAGHPSDELSDLSWDPGTAEPFGSGSQPPKQPEAFPLPVDHGVWLDEDERVGPVTLDLAETPRMSGRQAPVWAGSASA